MVVSTNRFRRGRRSRHNKREDVPGRRHSSPSHRLGLEMLEVRTLLAAEPFVPIELSVPPGEPITLAQVPVQVGVPVARGELDNLSPERVRLVRIDGAGEQFVPSQTKVLTTWEAPQALPGPETSIKYLQVNFLAEPVDSRYRLVYDVDPPGHEGPEVTVEPDLSGTGYVVDTGQIEVVVQPGTLIKQASVDLDGSGTYDADELVIDPSANKGLYLVDHHGKVYRGALDTSATLEVEENGPLQATLKAEGTYVSADGDSVNRWTVRMKFYAGQSQVKLFHTFIITRKGVTENDSGELLQFRDIGVDIPLTADTSRSITFPGGTDYQPVVFHDPDTLPSERVYRLGDPDNIVYDPAQVAAHPQLLLHQDSHKHYAVWDGDQQLEERDQKRSGHWMGVVGQDFGVTASVRWPWQNHPLALEWASQENLMRVHLWTMRGDSDLDLRTRAYLESRGRWEVWATQRGLDPNDDCQLDADSRQGNDTGTECDRRKVSGVGVSKTHEILLDLYPSAEADLAPERAYLLQKPVFASADATYARDTLAAGRIHPYDPERFPGIETYISDTMDRFLLDQADDTVIPNSDYGDSYGAFDFGDTLHNGKRQHRYWSHHFYAEPSIWWQHFRRSGDRRYLEFGEANARHHMDVDVVHHGREITEANKRLDCQSNPRLHSCTYPGSFVSDDSGIIHWSRNGINLADTQHVIPHLASYFNLMGYERARDVATEIGEMYKFVWGLVEQGELTIAQALGAGGRAAATALWNVTELYQLTWDDELRQLADQLAERILGNLKDDLMPGGGTQAFPLSSEMAYAFPGMKAYYNLTGRSDVWEWIKRHADFLRDTGYRVYLTENSNYWDGPAFVAQMTGDPSYIGVPRFFFDLLSAKDHRHVPSGIVGRAWWMYKAPLLMDAIVHVGGQAIEPPVSTLGQIILTEDDDQRFELFVQMQRAHSQRDELQGFFANPCDAPHYSLVLYDPANAKVLEEPWPGDTSQPCDSEKLLGDYAWYNDGGWVETIVVEPDGLTGDYQLVLERDDDDSDPDNDSHRLYGAFLADNSLGKDKVRYEVGMRDGLSPDHRSPFAREFEFLVPAGTSEFSFWWNLLGPSKFDLKIHDPTGEVVFEDDLARIDEDRVPIYGAMDENHSGGFWRRARVAFMPKSEDEWWSLLLPTDGGEYRIFDMEGLSTCPSTEAFCSVYFRQPLTSSVVDVLADDEANDGEPDTFELSVVDGELLVAVNGVPSQTVSTSQIEAVNVRGSADDDTLIVHADAEAFDFPVSFQADGQVDGDRLVVANGVFGDVTHTMQLFGAGQLDTGQVPVAYTSVEAVDLTGSSMEALRFELPDTDDDVELLDLGAGRAQFQWIAVPTRSGSVVWSYPTRAVSLNTDGGADTIGLGSFSYLYPGDLIIDAGNNAGDALQLNLTDRDAPALIESDGSSFLLRDPRSADEVDDHLGAQLHGIEVIDLDEGIQGIAPGDFYFGGTATNDTILLGHDGDERVTLRFATDLLGTFRVDGRVLADGRDGNDSILVSVLPEFEVPVEFHGGAGRDVIRGGAKSDVLEGGPGNDQVFGGLGNDTIRGGAGADQIWAGGGDDLVDGGRQRDVIAGGFGHDILLGGAGRDLLMGGFGRDLLVGGTNSDILFGGLGQDILIGGYTTHDDNDVGLAAMLAEWISDRDRQTRMQNLTDGTGSADPLNGNFLLRLGVTVLDDEAADLLFGFVLEDWFFD